MMYTCRLARIDNCLRGLIAIGQLSMMENDGRPREIERI